MDTTGLRARTNDQRVNSFYVVDASGGTPPIEPYHSASVVGLVGQISTMYDENHLNFQRRKEAGEIIIGRMVLIRSTREVTPALLTWTDWPAGGTGVGTVKQGDISAYVESQPGYWPTLTDINQSSLIGVAVAKAYARLNAAELCTGESLKDFGKTLGMLRSPFRSSMELIKKTIKLRNRHLKKSGSNLAKANANAWLEARYGWGPTLLDISKIVDHVHKKRDGTERERLVVRSMERWEKSVSLTPDFSSIQRTGTTYLTKSVRCGVGIIYSVKNRTSTEEVGKFLGTRPRDIPATLWEMMPYSFVVDQFTNVGQWIQAVTPNPAVQIEGSWQTTVTTTIQKLMGGVWYWDQPILPSGYFRNMGTAGGSVRTDVIVERVPNPGLPSYPIVGAKLPSMIQTVDDIALGAQQISRALRALHH